MFTGLVQCCGTVVERRGGPASTRLVVDVGPWQHRPDLGASIAVNGCCLTVVGVEGARLAFDVVPQTLAVTSLGVLELGSRVNLEHAATPTTFLGGHVVLGHVDGLAEVVEIRTDGEWRVRLRLPDALARTAVARGSVALDGVSLTIARVEDRVGDLALHPPAGSGGASPARLSGGRATDAFGGTVIDVCLIPETLARTNLGALAVGSRVNVEADYLAKLVARQLEVHLEVHLGAHLGAVPGAAPARLTPRA